MTFLQPISEELFRSKYLINGEASPDQVFHDVAEEIARPEHPSVRAAVQDSFERIMTEGYFIPGGRILANARSYGNLKSRNYNNCFSKDALVLTARGLIPISEVLIGDEVLTHRGNWKKVVNTIKRPYKGTVNVYQSSLFSEDIVVTPEHPFYQGDETWVDSKDNTRVVFPIQAQQNPVKLDLVSFLGKEVMYDDSFVWKKGEGITEGEKVNRYISLTPELAYICGFSICFNEKDISNLERIKSSLETIFGIQLNVNVSGNNRYYLRKANFPLANFFRSTCGESTKSKKIPSFIWQSNYDIQKAFLQGIIDTDGTVNKNGSIECRLANRRLAQSLQTLSMLTNLYPTFKESISKVDGVEFDVYNYYLSGGQSIPLRESSSKVYDDDRLNRDVHGRHIVKVSNTGHHYLEQGSFEKYEKLYDDYVYNISVLDDESYVVNNVVVHNCFTIDIEDSMEGIYSSIYEDAMISRMGGGVGFDVSKMRPEGSKTSNGGEASGPISFLRVFDASAKTISSGGHRRAAHIALLDVDHPDILKFITAKQGDKEKKLSQFNISVRITDKFMNRVSEDSSKIVIELSNETLVVDPEEDIEIDGVVMKAREVKERLNITS